MCNKNLINRVLKKFTILIPNYYYSLNICLLAFYLQTCCVYNVEVLLIKKKAKLLSTRKLKLYLASNFYKEIKKKFSNEDYFRV